MSRMRRGRQVLSIFMMFCMVLALFAGIAAPSTKAASTSISVPNGSFENDIELWQTSYTTGDGTTPITIQGSWIPTGGGAKRLDYWNAGAYTARTEQTITGLKNGSYTLSAWVERGAGFNESYMYAKDTGGAQVKAELPQSGDWVQMHLPVVVANNQLTLGFFADAMTSSSNFMGVDLVTLVLDEAAPAKALENASFESGLTGWETAFGPEGSTSPISIAAGWSPENGGTNRLNYWSDAAFTADTHQTVTGLENGTYKLTAWVSSGGGFAQSYMYAKETGRADTRITIPVSSSSWTQISLPVIIENNGATIGFYAEGAANNWLGIDMVALVKEEETEPQPIGVAIGNFGFQANGKAQEMDSWSEEGDLAASFTYAPGYLSSYSLTHSSESDYKVTTSQTVSGLENGYYTLTAWAQNSGGQHASYLFARDNGSSEARAALPIGSAWTKVYLRGIHVTNGTATIGLYSDAKAGNWAKLDFVELVKDDKPYRFLKGGDVSELTYVESQGGKFFDSEGNEKDLFQILKENGHDIVRLRVYNEPGKGHGDGSYYRPAGIMDKDDILKLARRAKAAGLQIQLSFHYSDYWTNGATHNIPHSWQAAIDGLATDAEKVDKLEALLHAYTLEVMDAMVAQGTAPEFVSLGNEMQSGILFPYGRASGDNWANLARFLQAGAEAVKTASPQSKIILHLDDAGNTGKYESFFDQVEARKVDYDIIGPSYYPFWTDKTIEEIVAFCNYFSAKYDKDIMIMETGFNWNQTLPNGTIGQLNDNGPYPAEDSSPQGQKEFMINLFNGLKSVDNGRVIGDLYWDPIMIAVPGVGWAIKESDDQPDLNVVSNTTLFDFNGKALPAHDAYKQNTEGTTKGHISGVVRGSSGQNIAHAAITVAAGGTNYSTKSDAAGHYFVPDLPVGTAYNIAASKSGYQGATITVNLTQAGEFTANQDILLIGGSITGTVKDKNDHAVANAKVSTIIDGITYSALTDKEGRYTLADLPAASNVTVSAAKDGYAHGEASGVSIAIGGSTASINIGIELNSGSITGIVVGSGQLPIAQAKVSVTAGGKVYSAESDAAGGFTIVNVPAGEGYTVKAVKAGFLNGESSGISVAVGGITADVRIELINNAGSITGIVRDSMNAPVAGATVLIAKGEQKYTAQTDASGKYALETVLGGSGYKVTASKAGYLNGTVQAVAVTALKNTVVNVKMPTLIPLTNAGFESQGENKYTIPGWTITGTENATFTQTHANAKDGRYVFSHWLAGAYKSDANQTITGLANGYYKVEAWFYNGGDQKEYYMYAKDSSGELARFNIPKTGSMTAYSMDVKVEHGELTIGFYADALAGNWALIDAVTLGYLGAGTGAVTGTVQDEAGNKLAGAEVKATVNGLDYTAVTNAAGEFSLTEIPEGSGYSVSASKAGFAANTVIGIGVADKQTTSGVTIVLAEEKVEVTPSPAATTTPSEPPLPTPTPTSPPVTQPSSPAPTPATQVVKVDLKQGTKDEAARKITVNAALPAGAAGVTIAIAAQQVAEAAEGAVKAIIVKTDLAAISLSPEMLKKSLDAASSSVLLTMVKIDPTLLGGDVQKAIGENTVYDFNLAVDGVKVPYFGPYQVKVELPYTLRQGEDPRSVVVFHIDDEGKLVVVKNAVYHPETATVTFAPLHFSQYAAGYSEIVFKDADKADWAKQSIGFLAARGIISGFADHSFRPGEAVTRAQFVHMLMELLDGQANSDSSTFSDVKEGAWYASSITAAQKLGIVKGKSDGSFGVNDEISREEMSVLIYRAAQAANAKIDEQASPEAFTDQAQISAYASEAVQAMQQSGLVLGVGQGAFAPKSHATRAQAAVILERLFHRVHELND
ncbi:glycosyl hydrolase 53 family protein [Paenibacillus sp. FJAT-27812]|uniref:glycosyl hydrolase 53 family protein n=1 Tax=Paenibacillus sp. FJAT-27812 TaxID=1684143 RepID=UPI0006A76256|nr:glycosyl hydrolase 53 family protein [Paenibacillus sp. FJAT-27812]